MFPFRWNPHRPPPFPRPELGVNPIDSTAERLEGPLEEGGETGPTDRRDHAVRSLGQATLPRSCGLSLDQVNYLMVDYCVGRPRAERSEGAAGSREGSRSGAELMVFVNDPGRSGSPVLSVELDIWKLVELGG